MSDPEMIRFEPPTKEELSDSDTGLQFVASYTRAVLDNSTELHSKCGTGIYIGIGGRLFFASAAHCIKPRPYIIRFHDPFKFPCPPSPFIKRCVHDTLDIGFLEVENDPAQARLSLDCISVDPPPLTGNPEKPEHRPTCIVGFPVGEFIRLYNRSLLGMTNFGTYPVALYENEYHYTFPVVVGRMQKETGTVRERELDITPHGYSGGGIWSFNEPPSDGRLIRSEHMLSLYAIQFAWIEETRLLKCVPIRYLIRLIHNEYADLQELLTAKFPFLTRTPTP
ncbi:hypothetical protein [Fimbriiglobus ruber]|nr:hypothetical protein [Fimbriiglobus ruber]